MKIYISCGHNLGKNSIFSPRDQGAMTKWPDGTLITEYTYARKIAREIGKMKLPNVEFVLVPEGMNLNQRIKWINERSVDGDACIELHMDSFTKPEANGSTLFYMGGSDYAKDKGEVFQNEYIRATGLKNRWVIADTANRHGRLWFVRDTKCLAYLLEMGFLTNESDRNTVWLKSAWAIILGISLIFP